jgi:hypothetical protein
MDNGESVSFLFTSTSCSHCAEWKSTFVSFLQDNPYEVNLFENGLITYTEYRTVLNLLKGYFDVTADDWGATPMLYVGKKGQLNFLGAANLSYQGLANGFKASAPRAQSPRFGTIPPTFLIFPRIPPLSPSSRILPREVRP